MTPLLVITNCPNATCAETIAMAVVEERLAACVNIMPPCRSIYLWLGAIEAAEEIPLLIKTTSNRYTELEAVIKTHHPYTVPEIIAIPISQGLPAYLEWLVAETNTLD
ncbi:MAG: divalent-cation tolerance protein CutA [Proteobacteria bacterium]|nr:divalent-cation tolerance protein CutA [Pseudomonadota bacterium]